MKSKNRAALLTLAGAVAVLPALTSAPPASAQGLRERRGGGTSSTTPTNSPRSMTASQSNNTTTTTTSPARGATLQNRGSLRDTSQRLGDRSNRLSLQGSGDGGNPWLHGTPSSANGNPWLRGGPSTVIPSRPSLGSGSRDGLLDRSSWGDRNTVILPPRGVLPPGSISFPQTPSVILPAKPNPTQYPVITPGLPARIPGASETYYPGLPRKPSHGFRVNGPTQVITRGGITIFDGYRSLYVPSYTCVAPYAIYNTPPYIGSTYVITAPYRYLSGRELNPIWPWTDTDRFYAADVYRGRALRAALNDLVQFWEENDTRALRRRVSPDLSVAVFQNERYTYSLGRLEFFDLSADALDRVTTLSFRFTEIRDRSDGLVNAYATHVYKARGDGATRSATVRYTLVYVDNDWYVSAVSLSPDVSR